MKIPRFLSFSIGFTLITNLLVAEPGKGTSPKDLAAEEAPTLVYQTDTIEATKEEIADKLNTRLNKAITRGVDFLVANQNENGSWGNATLTKELNVFAPLPGGHHAFKGGSTELALQGLLVSGDRRPEVVAAIEKAEQWLLEKLPKLRRPEQLTVYNNWGHAYGIRVLADLHHYHEGNASKQASLARLAESQVKMLYRYEYLNGGWGYYDFKAQTQKPSGDPTSFTTGSVLIALHEAKEVFGIEIDQKIVSRALRCLHHHELPDGVFIYSFPHWRAPRRGINRPAGSLARSQVCNAALRYYDDESMTDERIEEWLVRLTKRDGFLSIGRKRPRPHETHFQISGYFYYYGHYYASEALLLLPPERQEPLIEPLSNIILEKQEKDGSWWDFPLYNYHKFYGTGYVVTTLSRYRRALQTTQAGE